MCHHDESRSGRPISLAVLYKVRRDEKREEVNHEEK